MAARPPRNDDGPSRSVEFGIAAVDAHLRESDLSFPATTADVRAVLGDREVAFDVQGTTVPLSTVLDDVDRSDFETRQELLNALHPVFETYRQERSRSPVARLRSILPF